MKLRFRKETLLPDIGAFIFALLLGLVVSFVTERLLAQGRVLRGLSLPNGTSVSALNKSEVLGILRPRASQVASTRVVLRLRGETLTLSASELGVKLEAVAFADEALSLGRKGDLFHQVGFWVAGLYRTKTVSPENSLDQDRLRERLESWAEKLLPEPKAPSLTYHGGLVADPGRVGEVIDWLQLKEVLLESIGKPGAEVSVPVLKQNELVPSSDFRAKKVEAERYVKAPVRVQFQEQAFSLSPSALGEALEGKWDAESRKFILELSVESLRVSMTPLLENLERAPVEARFEFSSAGAARISESRDGLVLDEGEFLARLERSVRGRARVVELPFVEVPPRLSTKEAEGLGVRGLVSSFLTRHACCQTRVKNIHRAAEQLDGLVLRPGETFSLNKLLGPRTRAAGYHKAPTIVRGRTKDVLGGGISQLATTLFNAVLRGGYEIVQRQPHSVYFSRYPEGHEATVSFPEPDLIFRNDTKAAMVLRAQAAPTFIKLLIYGDNEGRVVRVEKSKRYRIVSPPKEYEPDDEQAPEEIKRIRAGQLGWALLVSRTVTTSDGVAKEEKREVVYKPRPELLRVHPCVIPTGEPGHTGEKCPEPEREEVEEELSDDVYYETTGGE